MADTREPEATSSDGLAGQFRTIVMRAVDGILVVDLDGTVCFANPAAESLLGRTGAELIGTHLGQPVVAGESTEMTLVRRNGLPLTAELRATNITWEGAPAVLVSLRDISELRRQQAALALSETKLFRAQRVAKLGHWEWRLEPPAVTWSEEIYRIFELAPDTRLTAAGIVSLIHPEDRAANQAFIERLLASGERAEFHFRVLLPDGRIKHVLQFAEVHRDDAGQPDVVIGTMHDETARRQAEHDLQASEARYRRLFEGAKDGILIVDADRGVIVDVNPSLIDLLGFSREHYLEKRLWEVGALGDLADCEAAFADLKARGYAHFQHLSIHANDGRRVEVEVVCNTYAVGSNHVLRCSVRDITERKRAEGLLHTRLGLLEFAATHSLKELLQRTLDVLEEKTGSSIGFCHSVDGDQKHLTLQAWSTRTVRESCGAVGHGRHYEISEAGVWADAAIARHPVVHNDYAALPHKKGLPEGHAPVIRELVVPIMRSDHLVALLGVGNKESDYTEADVETVSFLADVGWSIAERKLAEEQAAREKSFSNNVVRTAQAIVLVLDQSGKIVTFNPYMEALSGYALHEVRGKDWFETFLPERVRSNDRGIFGRSLQGVPTRGNIDFLQTRDGREILIEWYDRLLREEDGTLTGLLCVGQDVTEREQARQRLAASEERFRLVFDNAAEGILLTDAATRSLLQGNKACCDLLGYSPEELATLTVADIHPPEALSAIDAAFARQAAGEHSFGEAVTMKRKDGSLAQVDVAGASIIYDGRLMMLATLRDVTETLQLRASLAQSDRLASMGTLAAGVAHEINNPLTYILYNLGSLTEDIPRYAAQIARARGALAARLGEDVLRQLLGSDVEVLNAAVFSDVQGRFRDALNGARQISAIARGLSSFSRVEKETVAPVDLRYPIESALSIAFNEIKYRARIVKDYCTSSTVMASEGRIAQVFLNLLVNAAHAIDDGDVEHNKITIRTWQDGNEILAEVQDTGCGIPSESLSRIFDPFFTTKPAGIGTGLGLSIVKNIIAGYGGQIAATSEVGRGTRFLIRLPVARSEGASAEVVTARAQWDGIRGRILVIDDDSGLRGALKRILRQHEVVEAESGEHGRELLAKDQRFDVILCDMMMPRVSGVDVHKWLLEHHPQLARKLVFVTGGAFTPGAREYLEQVSNLRVDKPFEATNLQKMVAEWVRASNAPETAEPGEPSDLPSTFREVLDREEPATTISGAAGAMSPEMRGRLKQAAIAARYDEICLILVELRPSAPQVATALQALADRFDYAGIRDLLQ